MPLNALRVLHGFQNKQAIISLNSSKQFIAVGETRFILFEVGTGFYVFLHV